MGARLPSIESGNKPSQAEPTSGQLDVNERERGGGGSDENWALQERGECATAQEGRGPTTCLATSKVLFRLQLKLHLRPQVKLEFKFTHIERDSW